MPTIRVIFRDGKLFPLNSFSVSCDFEKHIILHILYILFLVQTFILRFKFKGDKLITLGVGLHSNEEENFLNRIVKSVKSELNKIVQGRHRNSARNSSCQFLFVKFVKIKFQNGSAFASVRYIAIRV